MHEILVLFLSTPCIHSLLLSFAFGVLMHMWWNLVWKFRALYPKNSRHKKKLNNNMLIKLKPQSYVPFYFLLLEVLLMDQIFEFWGEFLGACSFNKDTPSLYQILKYLFYTGMQTSLICIHNSMHAKIIFQIIFISIYF